MPSTWWRDASELVKEQSDLLDIDPDQRLLISGPPGSGKTNLLLLRANQLYLGAHPNLYVVVFGSLLKSFIQMGGTQYKFPSENVVTHASLFNMILRREGIEVNDSALGLMEARQHRANHLEDLINAGKIGAQFDALLLDEAQDYTPQEIRIFSQLTNVLVATADVRQKKSMTWRTAPQFWRMRSVRSTSSSTTSATDTTFARLLTGSTRDTPSTSHAADLELPRG